MKSLTAIAESPPDVTIPLLLRKSYARFAKTAPGGELVDQSDPILVSPRYKVKSKHPL